MKKLAMVMAAVVVMAGLVAAADTVSPVTCTFTNTLTEGVNYISAATYYRGASLIFTNCVLLTSSGTTQGLHTCAVQMNWGISTTNNAYSCSIGGGASSNVWNLVMNVPTNWESPNLQMKVWDSFGNTNIYPWKIASTKASM